MLPHNVAQPDQLFIKIRDLKSRGYKKIGLWQSRRLKISNLNELKNISHAVAIKEYITIYKDYIGHSRIFAHIPSQKVTWYFSPK